MCLLAITPLMPAIGLLGTKCFIRCANTVGATEMVLEPGMKYFEDSFQMFCRLLCLVVLVTYPPLPKTTATVK